MSQRCTNTMYKYVSALYEYQCLWSIQFWWGSGFWIHTGKKWIPIQIRIRVISINFTESLKQSTMFIFLLIFMLKLYKPFRKFLYFFFILSKHCKNVCTVQLQYLNVPQRCNIYFEDLAWIWILYNCLPPLPEYSNLNLQVVSRLYDIFKNKTPPHFNVSFIFPDYQ